MAGGPEEPENPDAVLARAGADLAAAVLVALPGWVVSSVRSIFEAWTASPAGAAGAAERLAVLEGAREAGARAVAGIGPVLAGLLGRDVDAQPTTPLAVVRTAVSYPTAVLRAVGVPPIERDAVATGMFPDDDYGLTPATLAALDPTLKDPALIWGVAKALAHRRRHGA